MMNSRWVFKMMNSRAHFFQNDHREEKLTVDEYQKVVRKYNSPLFEQLCAKESNLDDLDFGEQGTFKTTYTAIRKLNSFWFDHQFNNVR